MPVHQKPPQNYRKPIRTLVVRKPTNWFDVSWKLFFRDLMKKQPSLQNFLPVPSKKTMKQLTALPPNFGKRWWIVALVGVPLTSGLLWLTQADWSSRLDGLGSLMGSQLDAPYRYPYTDSLANGSAPTVRIQQEIGHYQQVVRQNSGGGLDEGALAIAYLQMARATGQGHWYLLANQTAQQSLAKLPVNNSPALAVLARVAEAQHDFATTLKIAGQIPDPKDALALKVTTNLALGKLPAASQAAQELVDLTLSPSAFTLQALVQVAQGNDAAALKSFQYALTIEEPEELSTSARTRTLLGRFYYERGQLELANDLYREALRILPGYPAARMNLAQLEIRRKRYGAAEQQYAKLTAASAGANTIYDPLVLRGRAKIKALQGDRPAAEARWSEAETLLRQSFTGENGFALGHRRDLSRLLLERGNPSDTAEAVALMKTEVTRRRDAETLETYAWALSAQGQWQQAQAAVTEAIALGTRDATLFHRAAAIETALGNAAQAETYRQKAQTIDPSFDENARQAAALGTGLGS